jgi:cytochrome c551/c552
LAPRASLTSEDLAKSSGCLTCHAMDAKKMGPSFKAIAAKYKGNAGAEAKLVETLSKAQGHPAVKASPDDIKKLSSGTSRSARLSPARAGRSDVGAASGAPNARRRMSLFSKGWGFESTLPRGNIFRRFRATPVIRTTA